MSTHYLLMRYRDLGGIDDAIEEHRKVLDEKGHVWGGWWAKESETLPVSGLKEAFPFSKSDNSLTNNVELFLLNSGKKNVTRITVSAFHFSNTADSVSSPEPDFTPSYFRDHSLPLWFKIIEIGKSYNIAHFTFSNYAYEDYAKFRTIDSNIYAFYDNSYIESVNDIANQTRTLILLRHKENTDRRINSSEEFMRTPINNFDQSFSQTNSNQILLLSDLHFTGTGNQFVFGDYGSSPFSNKPLSKAISELTNNSQFASLICAGDFTFRCEEDGFRRAESFLFTLMSNHRIDRHNIIIVPGNHDMKFTNSCDLTVTYTKELESKYYERLFSQLYKEKQNSFFAVGRRFLLKNKLPVEIVGLNSVALQQITGHFSGIGYVGEDQLNIVAKEMGWDKDSERSYAFRILVLHHHLFPVEYIQDPQPDTSYSVCLDSGLLVSFIKRNRINLVIHGHKHMHNYMYVSGFNNDEICGFHLLSLGSASSADLSQDGRNSIGILDFEEFGNVTIKLLEISNANNKNPITLFKHTIPLS